MQNTGISPGDAGSARPIKLTPAQIEQLAELRTRMEEQKAQRLDILGESLSKKRKDAIEARRDLGIDDQWEEDNEFYEGIDDANRHEVSGSRRRDGLVSPLPPTESQQSSGDVKSSVFVNITGPYCDSAAARIADMLMPTDDRAFSIAPTPVPELEGAAKGNLSKSVKLAMVQQYQTKEAVLQAAGDLVEHTKATMFEAKERSERAQDRVDDWFVETSYHGEVRKVIDDAAKLGTGVLKGPFPVNRKSQKVLTENGAMRLVVEEKIAPASKRIDPFNFFPDGACGENIHNGSYTWERDYLSRRTLGDLKGGPDYIDSQIQKCLDEGPQLATTAAPEPQGTISTDLKDRFEVWYFHGILDREDYEAIGCKCEEGFEGNQVHAIVTMVNARVIKAAMNPLDTGDFPYDVMVWKRQSGKWTGSGVARQIRTPQRIVNAATRNMMDNAGLSAGPQILFRLGVVVPADDNYTITPRKVWYIKADADINDIKQAFGVFHVDSKQAELMEIIQFGLQRAEDVTGLPLLLQGQQGKSPDTLGGMQMMNNNASTVLRRLAKLFDDGITEPHVRRYYVWLMHYGEDAEKGDFQINARGSSALVERDIQNQAVLQMGNVATNPAFGVDPKKWFAEYCKSQRLDPKNFQYTEEEQKQLAENAQQGPSDPRLAVAQLRIKHEENMAQFNQQILMIEQKFEAEQNDRDRQLEAWITQVEQSGTQTIKVSDIKARLADTSMKLRTQRDLSAATLAQKPPTEPAGRAPVGQSYQK